MQEKIINGKELSTKILRELRTEVQNLPKAPSLAVILIGDDPSSQLYVKLKTKACEDCGILFHKYLFSKTTNEKEIIQTIEFLNNDPETTGILVQLPLPEKFNTEKIISAIDHRKDIDGFHPKNQAKMKNCEFKILPPLPSAIVELVNSTNEKIENKNIVILCNHKLFGDPFYCVWQGKNTVEVITTEDKDWQQKILQADILIIGIGVAFFIDKPMIKQDAIIIDVGINKLSDGVIVGDVNIDDVINKVKFITPVPGGVGPMTVAMLIKNLVKLAQL